MDENQKNNPQEDRHDELRHELSQLQPEVAQEDKAEEEAEDLTYIPARRGSAHYTVPLALFVHDTVDIYAELPRHSADNRTRAYSRGRAADHSLRTVDV